MMSCKWCDIIQMNEFMQMIWRHVNDKTSCKWYDVIRMIWCLTLRKTSCKNITSYKRIEYIGRQVTSKSLSSATRATCLGSDTIWPTWPQDANFATMVSFLVDRQAGTNQALCLFLLLWKVRSYLKSKFFVWNLLYRIPTSWVTLNNYSFPIVILF